MQMTLRDFAKENGVSYEAVRQQVKRYAADLEGHIHQQGRTQYLDDVAITFLNSKRAQNPLIVYDKDREEELQELRGKVSALQEKVIAAQELALASQGALMEAQAARLALEAAEAAQKAQEELLASKDEELARLQQELSEARQTAQTAQGEAAAAKQAQEALMSRGLWARLRNKVI